MKTSLLISALAVSASTVFMTGHAAQAAGTNYESRHVQALDLALTGDVKGSSKILRELADSKLPAGEKDRVLLSLGRVLYQGGDFAGAITAYDKISAGSDAWFSSLEERAWTYMRLDQADEALGQLKTLLSPVFKEKAGPEAYFLSAFAHLRVCDYPKLFKDLDLFKERFREKVKSWEAAQSFDPAAASRLKETRESITKLSLVEAEAIQRLYLDEELNKKKNAPPKITKQADELSFPVSENKNGYDEEVWLDEVDKVRVRVSGCPQPSKGGNSL